ncbi:hypothetical protein LZ30DRAFT_795408 [Colletotrichum cereale]|nr:hypothetical protein LZ30DRAFT_795408 [Colletotrichum cereale]
MCQAENGWCIGCRKVRPSVRKCELYDPVADFCENMNLENPPLKPHFEHCDNLECKFVDPALLWHPDRPLSPDSQAFAVSLKAATDAMDGPPAVALDATDAESKPVPPQKEQPTDLGGASRDIEFKSSEAIPGHEAAYVDAASVRSSQVLKSPPVKSESLSRSNIPSEHKVAESASQISNGSLHGSLTCSNKQLDTRLRQTNAQTPRANLHPAVVSPPQSAASSSVASKDLSKRISPRTIPNTPNLSNKKARAEPLGMFEGPKTAHPRLPNTQNSINGSSCNNLFQANAQSSVAQLQDSFAQGMTQQRQSVPYPELLIGGFNVPAASMPTSSPYQGTLPFGLPQASTPSSGLRQRMRPAHQAVMAKLMNPNGVSSDSGQIPLIQNWQGAFHNPQRQGLAGVPPQPQAASATRQPQGRLKNTDGTASGTALRRSNSFLGKEVLKLHAQHFVPMSQPVPTALGAMNTGSMMGHCPDSTLDMSPQKGYKTDWERFFHRRSYDNQQRQIALSNETGMYNNFMEQAAPDLPDPQLDPWTQLGNQFQSLGHGLLQSQPAAPSFEPAMMGFESAMPLFEAAKPSLETAAMQGFQTQALPGFNFDGPKISQPVASSNDRLFWQHFSTTPLQSPMRQQNSHHQNGYQQNGYQQSAYQQNGFQQNGFQRNGYQQNGFQQPGFQQNGYQPNVLQQNGFQQNSYSPTAFQTSLYGHQMTGMEHPAKRMRMSQEATLGTPQFGGWNQNQE